MKLMFCSATLSRLGGSCLYEGLRASGLVTKLWEDSETEWKRRACLGTVVPLAGGVEEAVGAAHGAGIGPKCDAGELDGAFSSEGGW